MSENSISIDENSPHLHKHPSKLFVEVTTRCNLNCFMCVKQNQANELIDGDFPSHLFAALEPAFPHLKTLILNGIGEPLLTLNLEAYIRRAKKLMPAEAWIGFQTNGLLMTNLRALSLVDAGIDRICLSIDAVTPEMFSRVREGGEVQAVDKAFEALKSAKQRCGSNGLKVGVEFVAMRSNLHELPAAIEWAARRGASFAIVTHVLPYDKRHADEVAFGTTSNEAITLFQEWRSRAEKEHIDISSYFEVRFAKYSRNSQEQKVVDLVDAMKAEAEGKGIFLDLKKLLRIDMEQLEELAETFVEVEKIARENDMELKLPQIALSGKRRCTFVEEGAAFVSWQGDISPCYFLWHRYQCHASGWTQQVRPKIFGNIAKEGILDIWNSSGFQRFREEVLAYDYPSCSDCGLAPCDYINADTFEQDCHIRNVPCGACLWCMGVFHCLN